MSAPGTSVFVEAPGRLHLGVLDLGGSLGRFFGGLGTAAPLPPLLLSAERAESLVVEGEDSERVHAFAQRFLEHHRIGTGARVRVQRTLPAHVGLGSGTQLALSVGRALAELYGRPTNVESLARATSRTRRSGVGMWVFDGGGLVIEGGRRAGSDVAPLVTRLPFPAHWRSIVAIPCGAAGMSGPAEDAAFEQLPRPAPSEAQRVAHLVLMALMPAIVEGDIESFGHALSAVQETTGGWFAPVQGGTFRSASAGVIGLLRRLGVHGVGQSSWGPGVFGFVDSEAHASAATCALCDEIGAEVKTFSGPLRNEGARAWKEDVTAACRTNS